MRFWPIVTCDHVILDAVRMKQHGALLQDHGIICNVSYDSQLLFNHTMHGEIAFYTTLDDDKHLLEHDLTCWISGKGDHHSPIVEDRELSVCLACEVSIEHLDVTNLLTGGGLLILGTNNQPGCLKISTPIYRWLLTNANQLYKPYLSDPVRQVIADCYPGASK